MPRGHFALKRGCVSGAASDSASEVIDALSLPDFSRGVEAHVIDGLSLPALGDDGAGHKAVYWGERVAPVKPSGVYAKQPDGTWRRYVAECWLTSAAGDSSIASIKAERDNTLYIKWSVAQSDGVTSSKR